MAKTHMDQESRGCTNVSREKKHNREKSINAKHENQHNFESTTKKP
jgi:hypothetical protein